MVVVSHIWVGPNFLGFREMILLFSVGSFDAQLLQGGDASIS